MRKYAGDVGREGFSLMELSVVLLVIGVIAGGILMGEGFISAARLRALTAEVNTLKAGINEFEEIYLGLPGDLRNAANYFDGASNGDGNRQIAAEASNEAFAAVDHLNRAKLVDGKYTGLWGGGFSPGGNVISSQMGREAVIYVRCCGENNLEFRNLINVFAAAADKRAGVLTAQEAFSVDRKADDGNPDAGLIGGIGNWGGSAYTAISCYTGTGSSAAYKQDNKDKSACQLMFAYDWN